MASNQPNRLDIILGAQTQPLESDLQRAQQKAQQTGQAMQQGLAGPLQQVAAAEQKAAEGAEKVGEELAALHQEAEAVKEGLEGAHEHLAGLADTEAIQAGKEALSHLAEKATELGRDLEAAGQHALDLQRSLAGAFANPEQLQAVTNTVHELGVKFAGVISEEQLGAVAKRLQTFGQYSTETMERAANVSAATGASIDEVANALTRFSAGDERAAMMLEHQLNVKPEELAKFGAALDRSGKVLMDTAEHARAAGEALNRLFDSKYADAAARMADPVKQMNAALEELKEKMGQDMAQAEAGFAAGMLPVVQYLEKLPPAALAFAGGSVAVTEKLVGLGSTALQTGAEVAQLVKAWPALKEAMASLGPTLSKLAPDLSGVSGTLSAMGPYGIAAAAVMVSVGIGLAYAANETKKMAEAQAESNRIQEEGQKLWTKQAALYAMSAQEAREAGKTTKDYTEAIIGLHAEMDRKRGAGQDTSQDEAEMRKLIQARGELAQADQKVSEAEQAVAQSFEQVSHAYKTGRASIDDLIAAQERQVETLRKAASETANTEQATEYRKQANELEETLFETQKKRLEFQLNASKEAAQAGQTSFAELVAAHQKYISSLQAMGAAETDVNKAKLALFDIEKQAFEATMKARAAAEDWMLQHSLEVERLRQQGVRERSEDDKTATADAAKVQEEADQRALDLAKARHQDTTALEQKASADRQALAQADFDAKKQALDDETTAAQEAAHIELDLAQKKLEQAKANLAAEEAAGKIAPWSQQETERLREIETLQQHVVDVRVKGHQAVTEAERKATNESAALQREQTKVTLDEDEKRTEAQLRHLEELAAAQKQLDDIRKQSSEFTKNLAQSAFDSAVNAHGAGSPQAVQAAEQLIKATSDEVKSTLKSETDELDKQEKQMLATYSGDAAKKLEIERAFQQRRLQLQLEADQKLQATMQKADTGPNTEAHQQLLDINKRIAVEAGKLGVHMEAGAMGASKMADHLGRAADNVGRIVNGLGQAVKHYERLGGDASPLQSLAEMSDRGRFIGDFGSGQGLGDQSAYQPAYLPPTSSQPDLGRSTSDARAMQSAFFGTVSGD